MTWPGAPQGGWAEDTPTPPYGQPPGIPPRRRRRLPVVLGVLGLAVLLGAVIAVVLVSRHPVRSSAVPAPVTVQPSDRVLPATPAPSHPGWQVIRDEQTALSYEVPPGWKRLPDGAAGDEQLGALLTGVAGVGDYSCGGNPYSRGLVGSTAVERGSGDLGAVAARFAEAFGTDLYRMAGSPPREVQAGGPVRGQRHGVATATATATVTSGSDGTCLATRGVVHAVALDAGAAIVVLVVNGDLAGGPADPAVPPPDVLTQILDSAQPVR